MQDKINFIKSFFVNTREIGSLLPSSNFLAKKMIISEKIEKSNVILELGAGTGVFTKQIFNKNLEGKKVLIIEKNKDFYNKLCSTFPQYKQFIHNIDVLDLNLLLEEKGIKKIDLVISGLPFRSLPKNIFNFIINDCLTEYFDENSSFVQFSYFKNTLNDFKPYFKEIDYTKCWLNIPPAYVFYCKKFINNKK